MFGHRYLYRSRRKGALTEVGFEALLEEVEGACGSRADDLGQLLPADGHGLIGIALVVQPRHLARRLPPGIIALALRVILAAGGRRVFLFLCAGPKNADQNDMPFSLTPCPPETCKLLDI